MIDTIRIYVQRDRISQRGPLYSVRLGSPDGEVLASGTMEPALAAARALIARGLDPATVLEMWDAERPYPRLRGVLDVMVRQTVMEPSKGSGLHFGRYQPPEKRFASLIGGPKTANSPSGAIAVASDNDGPVRENPDSDADLSDEASS